MNMMNKYEFMQSLNLPFDTIATQSLRDRSEPVAGQSLRNRSQLVVSKMLIDCFGKLFQPVTECSRRLSRECIEVLGWVQARSVHSINQMLTRNLVTLTIVLLSVNLSASDWEIFRKGTNANAFLLIGTDARTMALGGEGAGLLNSSAIYWNPANAMNNPKNQLRHEVGHYLLGIDHQVSSIHLRLGSEQMLSATINNLDIGQEEITTVYEPQGTAQYYSSQALSLGLNYARLLSDRVTIGVQTKLIREQIWLERSQLFAWDIGLLYHEGISGFALGMAIQNIGALSQLEAGPRTSFTREDDESNPGSVTADAVYDLKQFPLPLVFRMGLSRSFHFKSRGYFTPGLLLNMGFSDGLTTPFGASFGLELSPVKSLMLRSGYQFNRDLGELSAGLGLSIPLTQGTRLIMDYAWIDMDYFGAVERYQLSLEF